MATASVSNTFVAGTTIQATQVNTNFSDLVSFLNTNVAHLDGSKTFTGTQTFTNVRIGDGTAGAPSLAAANDTDDGLFFPAGGQVGFVTGGTARHTISTTQEITTLPQRGAVGSASAPTYSFSGYTGDGFYYDASEDAIGFARDGANAGFFEIQSYTPTVNLQTGPNGTPLGRYVQIGPMVIWSATYVWVGGDASAIALTVTAPSTPNTTAGVPTAVGFARDGTVDYPLHLWNTSGSTYTCFKSASDDTEYTPSGHTTGDSFRVNGFYMVDI